MKFVSRYLVILALAAPLIMGCSGSTNKNQLPTFAVHGTVKIDGKPSSRAMLQLTPVNGKPGQPGASGTVDEKGNYTLQTYAPGDGIPAGSYTVALGPDYGKFMPVPAVTPLTIQIEKSNPGMELNFQSAGRGTAALPPPGRENIQ